MAEMSDYLENALLNLTLNGTALTAINDPYVSLHTGDPTDAGSATEVSGGSYIRQAASFATASGTTGSTATDADVTFPAATAGWGTITHIALWDAVSSGNMLYYTPLDASKTIDTGDIFSITSGNLTVTLA